MQIILRYNHPIDSYNLISIKFYNHPSLLKTADQNFFVFLSYQNLSFALPRPQHRLLHCKVVSCKSFSKQNNIFSDSNEKNI